MKCKIILFLFLPIFFLFSNTVINAQNGVTGGINVYFFHSITCPHCRKENEFLKKMETKYPQISVLRYEVSDKENVKLMKEMAKEHDAENMLGGVPLTFIGDRYFIGYDNDNNSGAEIEKAILNLLGVTSEIKNVSEKVVDEKTFNIPFFGTIKASDYSLPVLAVLLGFLDGFNICSLGALVLIIGLTLKLQKRRAIILLGGTFIVTTAIVYGFLIVMWAQLFEFFNSQINFIKIFVSMMALGGGIYFLKEYLKMLKHGAVCEFQESKIVARLMEKTGKAFEDNTKLFTLLGSVLLFAFVLTVVEFPCSAATPLVFAGVLSGSGIGTFSKVMYIALFILFYMLDEIIVFAVAAYRLKIWMTNGKFTKYAVLAEALILIIIGLVYLYTPIQALFLG
jgi:thiol-disulfide isomerase/thioredoxin